MEKWKDVIGYEGFYKVSNLGRVKSFCKKKPIILKPKTKSNGYLEVSLLGKSQYVHRLVVISFISDIKNGYNVNHRDGIKNNNNLDNLEITTISENNKHALRIGLKKPLVLTGVNNGNSKLKDTEILYIRKNFKKGMSGILAKMFGVAPSTILYVVNVRYWKHI